MQNQNQSILALVGLLLLVGVLLPAILFAQTHTISGKVVDNDTGEPLVYATIALENEAFGTITNLAGEFDFHLPDTLLNKTLVISSLGYLNYTIPVRTIIQQEKLEIKLVPGHILLDEVMVSENLTAANLLSIAITRIEKNYPMTPVEMDGFYRETKQVNEEYVALLEAAVKIYDKNYRAPRDNARLRERVSLVEVRRTLDYEYDLEKYFNKYNMLEDLLLENFVKYRTFNNSNEFFSLLKRKKVPGYNNEPINLVYIDMPGYKLKIYIDDNYAMRKIIFSWGNGQEPVYSYRKSRKLENRVMKVDKQIEFQEHDGKLYLKYIAARYENNWYNRKIAEPILVTVRDQALLINKVNYQHPMWIDNAHKMKRYGLQFQHKAYNKDFWHSYNVIKDMPLDNKVQLDLEKLLSLEDQFEAFN